MAAESVDGERSKAKTDGEELEDELVQAISFD
jgi:hypothetical protein